MHTLMYHTRATLAEPKPHYTVEVRDAALWKVFSPLHVGDTFYEKSGPERDVGGVEPKAATILEREDRLSGITVTFAVESATVTIVLQRPNG